TLSSLIVRAGGLTDQAFPQGGIFMREEIKIQERQQINVLTNRLQQDLALLALQNTQAGSNSQQDKQAAETLTAGQALLQQLRSPDPKGRLVVNIGAATKGLNADDDIQLRNRDTILIPRLKQYVTVIGEVQNPISHIWKRDLGQADYLAMSGGTTPR